jgi:exodeoxyribonuclease VII large subunit
LFDPARKRPLPAWPATIGIVTSPTGAALRDMLDTIRRRFPLARVVLAPTPVQGDEAPAGIVSALEQLNRLVGPALILLARGGGSIEDLWAFNDERVVRAVVASQAPVIAGVGHETDFTLADFAADLRAPTPTAAAELATPDQAELRLDLAEARAHLEASAAYVLAAGGGQLREMGIRLRLLTPMARVRRDRQRLDELARLATLGLAHGLAIRRAQLTGLGERLFSLNPLTILERGYSLVTKPDGQLVRRLGQVRTGEDLSVRVSDGSFDVRVQDTGSGEA